MPSLIARDCDLDDRCYRQLDPEYFAWLKLRMHRVKDAMNANRVPAEAFDELRQRFNRIQIHALELFGERSLLEAVRALDLEKYRWPVPEEFERAGPVASAPERTNTESERLARARILVDEIRDQALALGWTCDRLYFCDGYDRRTLGVGYGLVCYVGIKELIGEITRQSIELLGPPPTGVRSRLYNPEVDQPWVKGSE